MGILSGLEPERVFTWFERLSAIPRGSGDTERASAFLEDFARARDLPCLRDQAGNVIIRKAGTMGCEDAAPVILQGHMDMVCEKEEGVDFDFHTEPLRLRVRDGVVSAEGTTLGGDDGIAVAYCLAILDAADIPHPPLEVVLTTGEEIGMTGAAALDMSQLRGRILLNIDSEDEGIFLSGCAGGVTAKALLPIRREAFDGLRLRVRISGLLGGHSGMEIHKGRANASAVLGRVLFHLSRRAEFRVEALSGGMKDNAIPRQAEAVLRVPGEAAALEGAAAELSALLAAEYRLTDPGLRLTVERLPEGAVLPLDASSTRRAVAALLSLPNGVIRMSPALEGQVQTSLNLGILETEAEAVSFSFSVRSSVESEKEALTERIVCLMEALGGEVRFSGNYPAWEYRENSPLRDLFVRVFREQYGREPVVQAIHAGVECGLFAGALPGLDAISFGPDLRDIHTPQESMDVESVGRTWRFLLSVLRELGRA